MGIYLPPVTKNLLIINVLAYLLTIAFARFGIDLVNLLGLHYFASEGFRFFQPLTYMFLHDTHGLSHLFFNMFAVFMFGPLLERMWGAKRYLFYYLFTGVGAALIQQIVWGGLVAQDPMVAMYQDYLVTIGASGAVFGILLGFGILFPNAYLYIFFALPVKAKYAVIAYGLIELMMGLRQVRGVGVADNVAHFAHLGGMLFGLLLILYWRKKYGKERVY